MTEEKKVRGRPRGYKVSEETKAKIKATKEFKKQFEGSLVATSEDK